MLIHEHLFYLASWFFVELLFKNSVGEFFGKGIGAEVHQVFDLMAAVGVKEKNFSELSHV